MSLGERVPKLRFPGFEGEWEELKIHEIFEVTRGYVLSTKDTHSRPDSKYCYPVYSSQTKDDGLMGYYSEFLYKDAITWTTDGANAGTVHYRTGCFYCTNVCGVLLSNKGYANKCVSEILNAVAKRYVSYVGNPKLMNNVMREIPLVLPNKFEQLKISDFLSLLDSRIAAQRKLVKLLKKHKRGLIKRLFRPNEHTKWKSVRLGDVGTFHKGAPLSKADISEDGKPFILYGELYTTYGEIIKDVVRRTTAEIDIPYLSRCGDVIIPTSGETAEEIATASCIMSDGVVLGGDLNIYRSEHIDGRFLAYAVRFIISRDISRIAQGVSVVHISATELKRISVSIPSKDEQIRIISVLENYDNRILHSQEILKKMETTKDGLLQQLFV